MAKELYETTYQRAGHFSFGKNWQDFLESLSPEQIENAKASLTSFLEQKNLRGKRFLDLGSGSGLFSLAAHQLGADVVSVDADDESIASTRSLKEKFGRSEHWQILNGSALDKRMVGRLGTFDLVYSWGVLHHTGDMYRALDNAARLVKSGGLLYVAIYNDNKTNLMHGTSGFWLRVKRTYNSSNDLVKQLFFYTYTSYLWIGLLLTGKNPSEYIRKYRTNRGMSWKHDILDWLGGYPYEFAPPEKIINFLGQRDYACKKMNFSNTIGCTEYLFVRQQS